MMNRTVCLVICAFCNLISFGQTKEISSSIKYFADSSMPPKEALATAIEQARVEALGRKFGTLITQDILSKESDDHSFYSQLASAEVKGVWLEDLKEPEAKVVNFTEDGDYVIEAKVCGKAKPLNNNAADFETMALRNGKERRFADTDFKEDDKFYLYFKAPADGYVAAFLIDDHQQVFRILPHDSSDGQQQVKHDKEYVFFSKDHDPDFQNGDGMIVTCSNENVELNRIYVIYSPNAFVKPVDFEGIIERKDGLNLPPQLKLKEFSRWMGKVYSNDKKMSRKIIRLRISKN